MRGLGFDDKAGKDGAWTVEVEPLGALACVHISGQSNLLDDSRASNANMILTFFFG